MLHISSAFDSAEATSRLAAITGMEHDFDPMSDSQKAMQLKALADAKRSGRAAVPESSATWSNERAAARIDGSSIRLDRRLRLIWIGNALLLLAALTLFVFG